LRKIIKNKYRTKETIKKINNHTNTKDLRGSAFGLRPQATTENFTIKYEDYKYGVEALSNPKTPIHPNSSLSQITNNREFQFPIQVGGSKQIPNNQTKY
jgi:hypothetical protein